MTTRIAFVLALVIVAAVALDVMLNDGAASLFLGRKLFALLDWLAFWR